MKRRQTITLTLTYDDPSGNRQPPSSWDWQTILTMAMHGHGPETVKVGTYGPVKPLEDEDRSKEQDAERGVGSGRR